MGYLYVICNILTEMFMQLQQTALGSLYRFKKIVKYIISGGSAAFVQIGLLYTLTEYTHLHYVLSAIIAFTLAILVSFTLQKFWTFQSSEMSNVRGQIFLYLTVTLCNGALNIALLYSLVEWLHLWYIFAEILVAVVLAIATFFIYKNFVFAEKRFAIPIFGLLIIIAFGIAGFLATYKLTESPGTWMDEGIITQTAMNMVGGDLHTRLKTSPESYVSAGYVTTAYPVTYPIATSFSLFGIGLLQARSVMVLYLLGFVLMVYALARKEMNKNHIVATMFLIVTFAPLYGNGKNVLGEVPGLFFTLLFLLLVSYIEKKETTELDFFGAGLMLGLAIVTKPIFFLLLPPVGIVFLCSRRLLSISKVIATFTGFILPLALWFRMQFCNETFLWMLSIYANPHNNNIISSVLTNMRSFVTKPELVYALLLLGVWLCSIVIRVIRKQDISRAEYIAAGFSVLIYMAYLRGEAYYRYFFVGEVLSLIYFAKALSIIWYKRVPKYIFYGFIIVLISFQLYQSLFRSWVAGSYQFHRTRDLQTLNQLLEKHTVLLYQVPEVAVFLPTTQYYQYMKITQTIIVGLENLLLMEQGVPDIIITSTDLAPTLNLSKYTNGPVVDQYRLWYKK